MKLFALLIFFAALTACSNSSSTSPQIQGEMEFKDVARPVDHDAGHCPFLVGRFCKVKKIKGAEEIDYDKCRDLDFEKHLDGRFLFSEGKKPFLVVDGTPQIIQHEGNKGQFLGYCNKLKLIVSFGSKFDSFLEELNLDQTGRYLHVKSKGYINGEERGENALYKATH